MAFVHTQLFAAERKARRAADSDGLELTGEVLLCKEVVLQAAIASPCTNIPSDQ